MSSTAANPDRERLKTFFSTDITDSGSIYRKWDDLWIDGSFLPFDRHMPNPALHEVLEKHLQLSDTTSTSHNEDRLLGSPFKRDESRKWALVPGCGRGYDVLLLASYGFNAVGLEISETAVRACEALKVRVERGIAGAEVEDLSDVAFSQYQTKVGSIGRGTATFVVGDFFLGLWTSLNSSSPLPTTWDLVYDYTFLSALPVKLRPQWASRMRDLVKPDGGRLVCVEFPTYKDPKTGGPPWALPSVVYMAHLGRPGKELEYDGDGNVAMSEQDKQQVEKGEALEDGGMVRMKHWKAEQTHEIGKGTDCIGIWRRG